MVRSAISTLGARKLATDRLDVLERTQEVHAGQAGAGRGQRARPAAGRQQEFVIREGCAVIQADPLRAAIDVGHTPAKVHLDRMLPIEVRWPDQQTLRCHGAGEVFLRQRRSLVRP
jgi:hypothetical protein